MKEPNRQLDLKEKNNNFIQFTRKNTFPIWEFFPTLVWNLFMYPFFCLSARVASTCWPCWTSMQQGRQSCLPFWLRQSECRGFMVRDSRDSLVFLPVFYSSLATTRGPAVYSKLFYGKVKVTPWTGQHGQASAPLEMQLFLFQPGTHASKVEVQVIVTILKDIKLFSGFDPSSPEAAVVTCGTAPRNHWQIESCKSNPECWLPSREAMCPDGTIVHSLWSDPARDETYNLPGSGWDSITRHS